MKKLLVIAAFVGMCSMGAMAQSAIGVRLGGCEEVSFHAAVDGSRFWEFDAGVWNFGQGVEAAAVHNWIFAEPKWAPKGDFHWYAGVGVGVGTFWWKDAEAVEASASESGVKVKEKTRLDVLAGVAGMIGLKYNFWFPLQVSADLRPIIGPTIKHDGVAFNVGYIGLWPTLSARYILDK